MLCQYFLPGKNAYYCLNPTVVIHWLQCKHVTQHCFKNKKSSTARNKMVYYQFQTRHSNHASICHAHSAQQFYSRPLLSHSQSSWQPTSHHIKLHGHQASILHPHHPKVHEGLPWCSVSIKKICCIPTSTRIFTANVMAMYPSITILSKYHFYETPLKLEQLEGFTKKRAFVWVW